MYKSHDKMTYIGAKTREIIMDKMLNKPQTTNLWFAYMENPTSTSTDWIISVERKLFLKWTDINKKSYKYESSGEHYVNIVGLTTKDVLKIAKELNSIPIDEECYNEENGNLL